MPRNIGHHPIYWKRNETKMTENMCKERRHRHQTKKAIEKREERQKKSSSMVRCGRWIWDICKGSENALPLEYALSFSCAEHNGIKRQVTPMTTVEICPGSVCALLNHFLFSFFILFCLSCSALALFPRVSSARQRKLSRILYFFSPSVVSFCFTHNWKWIICSKTLSLTNSK